MSITRPVALLGSTLISPFWPAGTIAAFAVTVPVSAFSVDTRGWLCPVGHTVRYPSGAPNRGMAAKLSEYAIALLGMSHPVAASTGKSRCWPPYKYGPPSGPLAVRVSATRHGVNGKNAQAEGSDAA